MVIEQKRRTGKTHNTDMQGAHTNKLYKENEKTGMNVMVGFVWMIIFTLPTCIGAKNDCPVGEYWRSDIGRCQSCILDCSKRFCPIDCRTPPTIEKITGNTDLVEGGNLSLTCLANGSPYPQVSWTINSKVLKDQRITFPLRNTIQMNEIRPADAGAITCTAVNNQGNSMNLTRWIKVRERCKDGDYFEATIGKCQPCGGEPLCHQNYENISNKCPKECNGWHPPDNKQSDVISNAVGDGVQETDDTKGSSNPYLSIGLGVGISAFLLLAIGIGIHVVLKVRKFQSNRKKHSARDQENQDGADHGESENLNNANGEDGDDQEGPRQNQLDDPENTAVNHDVHINDQENPEGEAKVAPLPIEETNEYDGSNVLGKSSIFVKA